MATLFIGVSAQNPYAYGLSATNVTNEGGTFAYSLNAPAQAVSLQFFNGEELVATINMPDELIVAGDHSYNVNFADLNLPANVELTWKVNVQGAVITEPVEITDQIKKFYSPAGVAVDVNPESEYFGTMYMTESFASTATKYFTAPANNAIGIGLYEMDPRFEVAKNENGVYGFSCGMQSSGTTLVDWRPSRIHISDDGRMFILSQRVNTGYPLYKIDRATMTATPLFDGILDNETGIVTNGETQVAAGVGVAFDVKGSGDDLQIVMMTCTPGTTTIPANYKTNEYNLGSATTWATAPSRNITAFDGKALNYQGINLCYDNNNGLWFSQYRYTPTEDQPSYMHANLATDEADELDYSVVSRMGGMALNHDRTLMVRSEAYEKKLGFYQVGVGENNVPELTKLYEIDCPSFIGYNQLAFDYANNVIACDNQAEVFGMIQFPTDNPNVITPAAVKYNFTIIPPVRNYSVAGEPKEVFGTAEPWDQTFEGTTMTANDQGMYEWTSEEVELTANAVVKFKVVVNYSWDESYGYQGGNGNVELTVPQNGTYTLTVTYNPENNYVDGVLTLTSTPEPTKVYILGQVNGNDWGSNVGYEMTLQSENIYTADITIAGNSEEEGETQYGFFSFTTKLSDAENDWNAIAPYRFGAASEGDYWFDDAQLGQEISLTYNGGQAIRVAEGNYTLTVNLETMKLVITKKASLRGDVDGSGVVDVSDVNIVVNIILGKDNAANYDGRANVNGLDDVDVSDVNAVVNIILGKVANE